MPTTDQTRPDRPYPKFPLTPHKTGQWKKRVGGRDFYFGRWHDPDVGIRWGDLAQVDPTGRMWKAAFEEYNTFARREAEGQLMAAKSVDVSIEAVASAFLNAEHDRLDAGDIKPRTYEGHRDALRQLLAGVGPHVLIRTLDEETDLATLKGYLAALRSRFGAWTFNRHVRSLRAMFRWAINPVDGVLTGPLRLLGVIKTVSTRVRRREQREARSAAGGRHMPTIPELRALHDAASPRLRACYLLAYFAAYGQGDCAELTTELLQFDPLPHLGLPVGWGLIHFPRPKSEIDRACALPPIVVDAVRAAVASRPVPARAELANRAFLTEQGQPICYDVVRRDDDGTVQVINRVDNVKQWHATNRRRLHAAGTPLRPLGFYAIRHASITLTAGCDETARLLHEGHIMPGMRPQYVEGVGVGSLVQVGQVLLDHWNANAVTALVGGHVIAPPSASPPPAEPAPPTSV
jgi:hypothetical protein